jgi:hypothetical protein
MVSGLQPVGVIETSRPGAEHREGQENGADSNPAVLPGSAGLPAKRCAGVMPIEHGGPAGGRRTPRFSGPGTRDARPPSAERARSADLELASRDGVE